MKQSILLLATITGVLTLAACSDNSSQWTGRRAAREHAVQCTCQRKGRETGR